jgi:hypothetical protein
MRAVLVKNSSYYIRFKKMAIKETAQKAIFFVVYH